MSSEKTEDMNGNIKKHVNDEHMPPEHLRNLDVNKQPSKVLDLGMYGRIPLHTLSGFYIDTYDGQMLTIYQAKRSRSLGGWVYDGASCLAKYLEEQVLPGAGNAYPEGGCMKGQTIVELGAGTGVVGILAGYHGADAIITDLVTIVPLIQYNIDTNQSVMRGKVEGKELCWGDDDVSHCKVDGKCPDWLILANCIYYESSFEPLHQTMLDMTTTETKILVCYEERSEGIKNLIQRWHEEIENDFDIIPIPDDCYCELYKQDFVKLLWMKRKI